MHEDNSTCVSWVTDYKLTKKNRHIHKKYWIARQEHEGTGACGRPTINMIKCDTTQMIAGLLTKNCAFDTHDYLMRLLMKPPPTWPARAKKPKTDT